MDSQHFYAVIMAGGGGTRLWPLSRQKRPKQVLKLTGEASLFEIAVDRLDGVFEPEHIFVVTVQEQALDLMKICPQIPEQNYIIEPFPRGTASVVGLAAVVLSKLDKNAVMAVLTADHFIENVPVFQDALRSAYQVSQEDYLVTLGIHPSGPATGYGYIQRGHLIGCYQGMNSYVAKKFKEKPSLEAAKGFLSAGDHDWNSGMFIWKASKIMHEIERQMPFLHSILLDIEQRQVKKTDFSDLWGKITPQTIDYGIMENANHVAVIPVTKLGWSDVGSWDSLYEVLDRDAKGNIIRHNDYIAHETRDSIIFSHNSNRLIVSVGIEDLIIIDTGDALLVCSRDKAQDVKEIVQQLKINKWEKYL